MLDITIAFVLGALYGFFNPGKEDRINLLKKGLVIGIVIGIVVGILGALVTAPLGFIFSGAAFVGAGFVTIFVVFFFAVFFVIGTFIGDFIEHAIKR